MHLAGGFTSVCTGNNTMAQRNYPCDNVIYVRISWLVLDLC